MSVCIGVAIDAFNPNVPTRRANIWTQQESKDVTRDKQAAPRAPWINVVAVYELVVPIRRLARVTANQ